MERVKVYLNWICIVMFTIVSAFFASCSSSDSDEESVGNPIVGSWSCDDHYYGGSYGGTDTYVFKSDGSYEWSCTGDWWDDDSGRYSYNHDNGELIISNRRGTVWVYHITSLSGSSFILIDEEGDSYRYYRD